MRNVKTYSGDSDHSVCDLLSQVCLCRLLHLDQDHGGDLLSSEHLLLSGRCLNLDMRLGVPVNNFEGEVLDVDALVGREVGHAKRSRNNEKIS